ncbi:MAG: DUF5312 domain-containing protein [Treponema sp.]|nr:DUF5312 domain-containing protein [Treponema sp.]
MSDVFSKVISFISGDGSDKDILLKQLAKEITGNKYARFYRLRQGEMDPSLGMYLFSIYKIIYPLQKFFDDPMIEARIKQVTLESSLDKNVMDIIRRLSPEGISERKKSVGGDLSRLLQEDLAALAAGFDSQKVTDADKCYNKILAMRQFVTFDFWSLLKKFDPEIKEGDFISQPKFVPVDASILVHDTGDFMAAFPFTDEPGDWKAVFEIIKYCRGGSDVLPIVQWNNLLLNLKDLKQTRILELIGRLVTGNPILEIKTSVPHEPLSASWLEQKTIEVKEAISGILGNQRHIQIHTMAETVFGPLATLRLNYFTPDKGKVLLAKNLDGYDYALALNHLFTFIQEFVLKEMSELCDILLVRGQWSKHAASKQMSDNFHIVTDIIEEINQLDAGLSEEGVNGPRIRGALLRVDRDKSQIRYVNSITGSINDEAADIINRAVQALIVVGKHFKTLMDDFDKKPHEVIANWKELALVSKVPLNQRIIAIYKRINYFVQLMILETKPIEE